MFMFNIKNLELKLLTDIFLITFCLNFKNSVYFNYFRIFVMVIIQKINMTIMKTKIGHPVLINKISIRIIIKMMMMLTMIISHIKE